MSGCYLGLICYDYNFMWECETYHQEISAFGNSVVNLIATLVLVKLIVKDIGNI